MSKHASISPAEAADRLAIREPVEAYAHCSDRRDAKGQTSLFTADAHFVVFLNAKDPKPSQALRSREGGRRMAVCGAPVVRGLDRGERTFMMPMSRVAS